MVNVDGRMGNIGSSVNFCYYRSISIMSASVAIHSALLMP